MWLLLLSHVGLERGSVSKGCFVAFLIKCDETFLGRNLLQDVQLP